MDSINPTGLITITSETLQILAKQDKYPDLLALYMAYVEVTTWQKNNSVKATTGFMMKRLGWGKPRVTAAKKQLIKLGLIEEKVRRDKKGTIAGFYLLVSHVYQWNQLDPVELSGVDAVMKGNSSSGTDQYRVVDDTPNTNNLQISTNNYKKTGMVKKTGNTKCSHQKKAKTPTDSYLSDLLAECIEIINPREKVTKSRLGKLKARLAEGYTEDEVREVAKVLSKSKFHRDHGHMSVDHMLTGPKFGMKYAMITSPPPTEPQEFEETPLIFGGDS